MRPAFAIRSQHEVQVSGFEDVSMLEANTPAIQLQSPSPRRVAAGRRNRALSRGLTQEGRDQLRLVAMRNRPWLSSTGPRSPEGKRRVATNGKQRQTRELSVREARRLFGQLTADLPLLRGLRLQVHGVSWLLDDANFGVSQGRPRTVGFDRSWPMRLASESDAGRIRHGQSRPREV